MFERAVFNSMEIALGGDYMKKFALSGEPSGLKVFQDLYGKQLYEKMRRFTNRTTGRDSKKFIYQYEAIQNEFLHTIYNKKFNSIKNIDDAKKYFSELKQIQNFRVFRKKDKHFEIFYKTRYNAIKKYLSTNGIDTKSLEEFSYKDIEIHPIRTEKSKYSSLNIMLLSKAEFSSLEQFKRFRYIKDDKIMDVVTKNGTPIAYGYCDDFSKFINGRFVKKEGTDSFKDIKFGLEVCFTSDGKLLMSSANKVNENLDKSLILEECEIDITPKDWENERLKNECSRKQIENKGIFNKINNFYKNLINILRNKDVKRLTSGETSKETRESSLNDSGSMIIKPDDNDFNKRLSKGAPSLEEQARLAEKWRREDNNNQENEKKEFNNQENRK